MTTENVNTEIKKVKAESKAIETIHNSINQLKKACVKIGIPACVKVTQAAQDFNKLAV